MTTKGTSYTAIITKNPITNRFDVMVAAIGSTEVFKHGSYATMRRAENAAKEVSAN
jgi:hypothetical protein